MSKVIFTPWKTQSQLLAVRDQFYPPPSYTGPDLRSLACAKVSSWKLRGNLPHPVEATALLTDAILHDDAGKNSIFSIRATYAAAFCRFVTVLVDSKLPGQRKTMFQRAIDLGLPASFVELRHEATHRELPALIVLRNATQRSLEWLWGFYWVAVTATVLPGAVAVSVPEPASQAEVEVEVDESSDDEYLKNSIRGNLGMLEGGNEGETEPPRKKRKALQHQSQYKTATATQLISTCKASKKGNVLLSRVLLDEVLVPERSLGDSLQPTFTRYEHLLQMITESHPAFLSSLTEEMVNDLAFTPAPNSAPHAKSGDENAHSAHSEGIYMWLDHILRSSEWKPSRRLLSSAYLLAVCEGSSNQWTDKLKGVLSREGEKRVKVKSTSVTGRSRADVKAPGGDAGMNEDATQLRKFGWESLDLWDSRPLGIV